MLESSEEDIERLKRYIIECKTCTEEGLEGHIQKLRKIFEKYPLKKIKENLNVFKALGKFNRIKILLLILNFEKLCACEIIVALGLSQSTISHHLSILENANVISNFSQGKWKYYRITEKGKKMVQLLTIEEKDGG